VLPAVGEFQVACRARGRPSRAAGVAISRSASSAMPGAFVEILGSPLRCLKFLQVASETGKTCMRARAGERAWSRIGGRRADSRRFPGSSIDGDPGARARGRTDAYRRLAPRLS